MLGRRVQQALTRITSYNVCYTKLLRFDETALKGGTPDQSKSFGIERVYVNGKLVLNGDALDETTFRTAGRAIRA